MGINLCRTLKYGYTYLVSPASQISSWKPYTFHIHTGGKMITVLQNQSVLLTVVVLKIWLDCTCLIWQQQFRSILKIDHGELH